MTEIAHAIKCPKCLEKFWIDIIKCSNCGYTSSRIDRIKKEKEDG